MYIFSQAQKSPSLPIPGPVSAPHLPAVPSSPRALLRHGAVPPRSPLLPFAKRFLSPRALLRQVAVSPHQA